MSNGDTAGQGYYDALQALQNEGASGAPGAGGGITGAPSVGDAVALGAGIVGIVLSIIQGVATIQKENGEIVEQPAAQVIVIPAPPVATAMDWTPIAVGGGVLLLLFLFIGMRR